MDPRLAEAMSYVRDIANVSPFDETKYRTECEYLVDHVAELPCHIFINLPGGLSGNQNPEWDKVKAGSVERCSCGNERTVVPSKPRTKYEPSTSGPVVVSGEEGIYLKPIGGDKASAYFKLWVENNALAFMDDPLAPLLLSMDIFSTKGFALDKLAEALSRQTKPAFMMKPIGDHQIPVFAINSVDVEAQTATITPDANVEIFNPDECPDGHKH